MGVICNDKKASDESDFRYVDNESECERSDSLYLTHMNALLPRSNADGNGLNGELPQEIALLQHVTDLSLDDNDIVGRLPSSLHKMTKLSSLTVAHNDIVGPIPFWIGQLTNLKVLTLSNNKLNGPFPPELEALTSLTTLALDDNEIVGDLSVITKLKQLEDLYLDGN